MPMKSPAQHRLMEAAAHTKGGYGGVPQSVGKEFVAAGNSYSKGGEVMDMEKEHEERMRLWQERNGLRMAGGGEISSSPPAYGPNYYEEHGNWLAARDKARPGYVSDEQRKTNQPAIAEVDNEIRNLKGTGLDYYNQHGESLKKRQKLTGYAEGGLVEDDYEPEMEMIGEKGEIDDILDNVIRMCGDPECDYEFAEEVNALPSSVNPENKDKDDMPPVEHGEEHDEVSMLADEMREKEEEEKYHGYGMRRFPQ